MPGPPRIPLMICNSNKFTHLRKTKSKPKSHLLLKVLHYLNSHPEVPSFSLPSAELVVPVLQSTTSWARSNWRKIKQASSSLEQIIRSESLLSNAFSLYLFAYWWSTAEASRSRPCAKITATVKFAPSLNTLPSNNKWVRKKRLEKIACKFF